MKTRSRGAQGCCAVATSCPKPPSALSGGAMSDKANSRRNRPALALHVPEPPFRPGDTPDFSSIKVPAAGEAPLHCPCHGGKFARDGKVLDGPPPMPLRRLRLELPQDPKGMIYLLEV